MSKIVSIATGVPPFKHQQEDICKFADQVYCGDEQESRKMKFLYRHSGINTRYSVMPDYGSIAEERMFYEKSSGLEPFPDLEKRMRWYADHAVSLSVSTIEECIHGKIEVSAITHLITVSCTGLGAPGLDLEIMEAMELPGDIFRTSVNFMGCYAAIHALKIADAICNSDINANVIIVCTELCTLHFQKENSIDNITSTLLFGDGSAAMLVQNAGSVHRGFSLKQFYSEVSFRGKKDMSWQLSSKGFLMSLSGYVPDLLKEDFNQLLEKALIKASLDKKDISHWCVHPGGTKILEAIEKSARIDKTELHHSYDVLREFGNMSSPTVVFVLKRIMEELQDSMEETPRTVFGVAFGPGLTMETFLATYD
ncbi:MAG: type III polyketide synthase [Bacteroidota bacterium]